MDGYLELNRDDRRLLCEQARAKLNLLAESIEKDFWVCWTLRELFTLAEWGPRLTFKGGTSLSMGWKLIERFSEDIVKAVVKIELGARGEAEPTEMPQIQPLLAEAYPAVLGDARLFCAHVSTSAHLLGKGDAVTRGVLSTGRKAAQGAHVATLL